MEEYLSDAPTHKHLKRKASSPSPTPSKKQLRSYPAPPIPCQTPMQDNIDSLPPREDTTMVMSYDEEPQETSSIMDWVKKFEERLQTLKNEQNILKNEQKKLAAWMTQDKQINLSLWK
ncbi:hypothetical protein ACLMJK_002751 [Lecanora helva]